MANSEHLVMSQLYKYRQEKFKLEKLLKKVQQDIEDLRKEYQDPKRQEMHQKYMTESWDLPCCYRAPFMYKKSDYDEAISKKETDLVDLGLG